jgi:hypothetical protein
MTTGPGPDLLLVLSHDAAGGRIAVDINAFVDFDLSLTRSLRELVSKSPFQRPVSAAFGRISMSAKPKPK